MIKSGGNEENRSIKKGKIKAIKANLRDYHAGMLPAEGDVSHTHAHMHTH